MFDGIRTCLALRPGVYMTLLGGLQRGKLGAEWAPLPNYPVKLVALLYNKVFCGSMRSSAVEKELRSLLGKDSYDITEHIMATEKKEAEVKAKAVKGQAPAAKKAAAPAKASAKAPAAAKEAKPAAAPAKTPAKAAKNADAAATARKGRPGSLDPDAKLKKGATKLEGTVREGTVREALMKKIISGVGGPLSAVLGTDATGEGHTVKAVDVHFAINAGYVSL